MLIEIRWMRTDGPGVDGPRMDLRNSPRVLPRFPAYYTIQYTVNSPRPRTPSVLPQSFLSLFPSGFPRLRPPSPHAPTRLSASAIRRESCLFFDIFLSPPLSLPSVRHTRMLRCTPSGFDGLRSKLSWVRPPDSRASPFLDSNSGFLEAPQLNSKAM
ncbi:hypothetical protein BDN71DRAFT_1452918 [Pleurotus eryngii]|uniref:Uncharacterized protein n=1 Tax=Pleurotus eryngii TaxID=5323 RepID=A0A9P5ZNQ9_PLEER|nr:hypothetical protein BDN71DRAFT_1452918 [Pleurotus eryngii]